VSYLFSCGYWSLSGTKEITTNNLKQNLKILVYIFINVYIQALPRRNYPDAIVRFPHILARHGLLDGEGFERNFGGRVYKGEDAKPGDLPFIVSVSLPLFM